MITYTDEKKFTQQSVQDLFLSVGWVSGKYPSRLYKALLNSSTVLTAWFILTSHFCAEIKRKKAKKYDIL